MYPIFTVPGVMELAVILLIFVILFGVPLVILGLVWYFVSASSGETSVSAERIAEIESAVADLEERLDEER